MAERIYSFLGLAAKAGRLVSGDETVERAVKSRRANLVIVSADASDNTRKKFGNICGTKGIEIRSYGEKELLGRYTGKEIRSVIAVTDRGFAGRLIEMIDGAGNKHGGVN